MNYKILLRVMVIGIILLNLITSSCVPYSKIKYFNDIDELKAPIINPMNPKAIAPFDKLSITVISTDEQTARLLNLTEQGNSESPAGYIVDSDGNINFPFVGKIEIGGLTLAEASEQISKVISSIITRPVVIINYLQSKVTVMGEVENQGIYPIYQDKINIYEALALGGGLSQFADRTKVILLRSESNKLTHYKLDLTNSKIASSHLYYILPNDIIIVEPLRNKSWNYQNAIFSTILATITAVVGILFITRIN